MRHKRIWGTIVRKLEQATRAMATAGGSGFNPGMRTPEKGRNSQWTNWDRPSRRTIDGQPICNNCGNPGNIVRYCPKGKGCFNCGDPGNFSRQFPKRKQDGGSQTNKNRKIRPKSRLIPLLVSQTRTSGKGGACHRCLKFSPNWFSSSYS